MFAKMFSYRLDGISSRTKSICMASSGPVTCSLTFPSIGWVSLLSIPDSQTHCSHDMHDPVSDQLRHVRVVV